MIRAVILDMPKHWLAERELVQSQYDGFRKGVRELLAQADAAAAPKSTTETPAGQPVAQK